MFRPSSQERLNDYVFIPHMRGCFELVLFLFDLVYHLSRMCGDVSFLRYFSMSVKIIYPAYAGMFRCFSHNI